jgi:hypothetical protein
MPTTRSAAAPEMQGEIIDPPVSIIGARRM